MSPDYERVVGRSVSDKTFRTKFLADPEQAIKDAGFVLTDEEIAKFKELVTNVTNQKTVDEINDFFDANRLAYWQ